MPRLSGIKVFGIEVNVVSAENVAFFFTYTPQPGNLIPWKILSSNTKKDGGTVNVPYEIITSQHCVLIIVLLFNNPSRVPACS